MSDAITQRKTEHLALAQQAKMQMSVSNGLDNVRFEPMPLPEINLQDIDTRVTFLGKPIELPLIIASMSGGTKHSQKLNEMLATVAQEKGIAMGLGSMRIAVENNQCSAFTLRNLAPTIPLLANLGATQLLVKNGIDNALRCIDIAEADAMIIHLNPLQEAIQPGGDTQWSGISNKIEMLVKRSPVPVVIKEVGHGIGPTSVKKLKTLGITHIDIAGAGGTSWAGIETQRAITDHSNHLGEVFHNFGIPLGTALTAINADNELCDNLHIIASGGIRSGLDMAKALRLGASTVAAAKPFLDAVQLGEKGLRALIDNWHQQLKITCLVTGSIDISRLKKATLF